LNFFLDNELLSKNKTTITYIYGHINPDTDAILSPIVLADFLKKRGSPNNIIPCRLGEVNKETKFALNYFKVNSPRLIMDLSGADEVILVDHNAPSQSLDFKNANIVGVIDHHAITGFESEKPIDIITKPVGCTCTILYELYMQYNISISDSIAGLIISAIISDTLLLKSSITTEQDIQALKTLSERIGIDYLNYGRSMLMAGTEISDLNEYEIIELDSKNYKVNGYSIQIAFLNSVDISKVLYRKAKLLEEIDKFINKNKLELFMLVIVDIMEMDSTALVRGNITNVVETAFNVEIIDSEVFLKGVSSRKKDVYPKIANVINEMPEYNDIKTNDYHIIKFNTILYLILLLLV
jgi:manganese-dependent inorganic pyrophosphatase